MSMAPLTSIDPIEQHRLDRLTNAGLTQNLLHDQRRSLLQFVDKFGRLPMLAKIGRHVMRETIEGFKVGCQIHSFQWWARNLDNCADQYRATKAEREGARALINAARILRGMRRMSKVG